MLAALRTPTSTYMAAFPDPALQGSFPSTSEARSVDNSENGFRVEATSARRELSQLRQLPPVKEVKERRGRGRTARKLDRVDSYDAYMADRSSVDNHPDSWERRKGKGKEPAVEKLVARRETDT
ncbi:hypothetical protein CspHIS471_0704000 [Cutaneotrichosporon sp. HIS471]|nr:hypothetical protein CspHIS471_0704000 [Cutaneotrichosporon sp. HIS471]